MLACHYCDEPRCSNPRHIFPGTASDNSRDAFAKHGHWGAIRRGESHGKAKLTLAQVSRIKSLLRCGEKQIAIAAKFDVDQTTVSNIATGKRWGWLP